MKQIGSNIAWVVDRSLKRLKSLERVKGFGQVPCDVSIGGSVLSLCWNENR